MGKNYITATLKITGMTCVSCVNRIERTLKNKKGIANAIVSYSRENALVTYDPEQIDITEIIGMIESLGYRAAIGKADQRVLRRPIKNAAGNPPEPAGQHQGGIQAVGILVILIALYVIISRFGGFDLFNSFPQARDGMGYGMLFAVGLLTSAHCVAMCGGINLSQCVPNRISHDKTPSGGRAVSTLKPSILYNSGRVISYTVIGGIVGALGSAVSFSSAGKGFVTLAAGIFMVVMGLNMLNVFPWLRRFNPRMPKIFAAKIDEQKSSGGGRPFYVGLLNGLMPCGPLQAMQLYALSTGDPGKGALSMLVFSLGTVPLMFGRGALSSLLTKKYTAKMMTVSAGLVILLGVVMFSRGMALTGYAMPFSAGWSSQAGSPSVSSAQGATAELAGGVQTVTTTLDSGRYEPLVVQKGIPVRWNLQADSSDINGCNNRIVIPEYNLEKQLQPGDNIIEFTPDKSGVVRYSCWMGMIRSQITVVDDLGDPAAVPQTDESINNRLPSCCGGGV